MRKRKKDESVKLEHYRALINLSALINSSLDIAVIRKMAIEAAAKVTDSNAGSLLFVDEETEELYFDIAIGKKGEAVKPLRLEKGQGIAGWVAAKRRPAIVNDVQSDPRFLKSSDQKSGFVTKNMICTPIKVGNRVLGVLQAINKKGGAYSSDDLDLLMALSNQIAVAIENARLYQEMQENFMGTIFSLTETVEKKDPHAPGHARRVMDYSLAIARVLGLSRKETLNLQSAAILHDAGKTDVKGNILRENDTIAKIIAVADAFDTMTSGKADEQRLSFEAGFDELKKNSGSRFAPEVVCAFVDAYNDFGIVRQDETGDGQVL